MTVSRCNLRQVRHRLERALPGDIVRLLQSLPENGHISIHISARAGPAQDGRFSLGGLKTVREKLAAACKWPGAIAGPRN